MGDVRHVEPGAVQVRAAQPLDARQWLGLDRAELGKVLGRDLRDAHAARGCGGGRRCGRRGPAQERLDVLLGDPALLAGPLDLGEVDLELAGEAADARAGVDRTRVSGGRRCGGLGRRRRGRLGRGRRLLLGDHRGWRRDRRLAVGGLELDDGTALAHPVADIDQHRLDRAVAVGRNVHGGLVGFKRQQRVVSLDRVAGLDVDLDDRDVLEVPDIGNLDLDRHPRFLPLPGRAAPGLIHYAIAGWPQTRAGFAFSGSIPYLAIASATLVVGRAPSSARLSKAAKVTQWRSTSKKWRSLRR